MRVPFLRRNLIHQRVDGGTVFHMPAGIGPLELVIVLVIVLVIFGPKRLPGLGRQLGGGIREFKDSITSKTREDEEEDDAERRPKLTAAAPPPSGSDAPAGTPAAQTTAQDADRT
jgi:sec-independent protein translocase protein TatA